MATELDASTLAHVDLSTGSVRSSLATTVATALGHDLAATWDETVHALGDTGAVLILDNVETALAVDPDDFRRSLRELLDRCRHCRILATSRERLGVNGAESIVRVGPLTPGEAEDLLDKLLSSHGCSLTVEDRDAMARVHAVADGLPLALVFSAAWLSEVSVTTFLQEWQRSRTALFSLPGFYPPDRASSFDVSVSLSFDMLKADSRQVLYVLSLHPAGATDVARVTGDWHRALTLSTDARRAFRSVPDGLVDMTNTAHSMGETRLAMHDEEFEGLTRRSISFEESRRWPLEKKGSVFHSTIFLGMPKLASRHRSSRDLQRSFLCYGV